MISRRDFLKAASVAPLLSDLAGTGKKPAEDELRVQCLTGLREKSDRRLDNATLASLDQELEEIHRHELDEGFLFLAALVRQCREAGILLHLRGPAIGSLVTYCLGANPVFPGRHNLLFERFIDPVRSSSSLSWMVAKLLM